VEQKKELLNGKIPKGIKQQLSMWRDIKDHIDEIENYLSPFKDRLKEISYGVEHNLSIEDGTDKSETVSIDGCATTWKKRIIGLTVTDFSKFQDYLTRNDATFVMRKQVTVKGVEELHRLIMEGELPSPKSAEFTTYDKITIRKK
tara:strand:- start:239 stop:673 length:435 start_codon:yes stop_codon:yes gene_type:complete